MIFYYLVSLFFLFLVAVLDYRREEVKNYVFLMGLLSVTGSGVLLAGSSYLSGVLWSAVFLCGSGVFLYMIDAWYIGDVFAMFLVAAGMYSLSLVSFFIFFIVVFPLWIFFARRYLELTPLIPGIFLVYFLTFLSSLI